MLQAGKWEGMVTMWNHVLHVTMIVYDVAWLDQTVRQLRSTELGHFYAIYLLILLAGSVNEYILNLEFKDRSLLN